jgi:CRISPR-associated protein Csx16
MTTYFVTRHAGAKEWARRRGVAATVVEHLDPAVLDRGDIVLGSLPAQLVAEISARGVRYGHLAIDLPQGERGKDLSADDMDRHGAQLVEISARTLGPFLLERRRSPPSSGSDLHRRWRRLVGRFRHWLASGRWRIGGALAVTVFVLIAVPGALGAIVTNAWAIGRWTGLIGALALSGLFYVIAFLALSMIARTVVWSRLRTVAPRESRCRVLIMGLSELPAEQLAVLAEIKAAFAGRCELYAKTTRDYLGLSGIGDANRLKKLAVKWQQNVRAGHQHGDALEAIFVLPSEESLKQWSDFVDFMHDFFPGLNLDLVCGDDGRPFKQPSLPGEKDRDYEDYAYVWAGLSRAVDQAHERFAATDDSLADDEICIDVAAGPKTFSMAGANVTLNRELKLSYVSNDGIVSVYNAEVDTADALRRVLNAGGAGL